MIRIALLSFVLLLSLAAHPQAKKAAQPAQKKTSQTQGGKQSATAKKQPSQDNSIKGLKNQQANVQKKIKEQERQLNANKAEVKKRLGNLVALGGEITQHRKVIDGIAAEIAQLDNDIRMLENQLATLEKQLQDRKDKYVRSVRYMAQNRSIQDRLMFVFSADNLAQMYRRMRFVREYAAYQHVQGEMVKEKQAQVEAKRTELDRIRADKNALLAKSQQEQAALESKQAEQQKMVKTLERQQKTIQAVIAEQRKKDAALNAQIDRLVAEEVARAKARAEAEARERAAKAEAEAKRRAAELARKQEEAEAKARELERRAAQAKTDEERRAIEKKAQVERERADREIAAAKTAASNAAAASTEDLKLSGTFERNKGRLPMPCSGRIVNHYGLYNVDGLKNVQLDNKGINILAGAGAAVSAIYDGEVSAVFSVSGSRGVMVRHGQYISVYFNLASVNVQKGQKVSTRQTIGTVDSGKILQFQLRKGTAKLIPEAWLEKSH